MRNILAAMLLAMALTSCGYDEEEGACDDLCQADSNQNEVSNQGYIFCIQQYKLWGLAVNGYIPSLDKAKLYCNQHINDNRSK